SQLPLWNIANLAGWPPVLVRERSASVGRFFSSIPSGSAAALRPGRQCVRVTRAMELQRLRQSSLGRAVAPPPVPALNTRLSLLMFLLYTAPGAVVPIFSLRLKELGFSP